MAAPGLLATQDSQGADIPGLELEDSQELRRRIYPPAVVQVRGRVMVIEYVAARQLTQQSA
jgi:hypothetical protein